jgi:hypothetical protein
VSGLGKPEDLTFGPSQTLEELRAELDPTPRQILVMIASQLDELLKLARRADERERHRR